MSVTRISLYPHELKTIAELTVELVRLRQSKVEHLAVENIGPEIFSKLVDALYGNPARLAVPWAVPCVVNNPYVSDGKWIEGNSP